MRGFGSVEPVDCYVSRVDRRSLIERYTSHWNAVDVAGFRSMIVDGCIRHDPGSTVPVSLDENERRFLAAHAAFPGLQLTNAWMWEDDADCITVAYTMTVGATVRAGLEVFRFAGDQIAEVWNVAPNDGDWLPETPVVVTLVNPA